MEEQKFVRPFFKLQRVFPKDTMWVDGIADIVGYSPKENLHFVIDDGNRASDDGKYVVHAYRPKSKLYHLVYWNAGEYPFKYLVNEEYADFVYEKIINFSKV